MDRQFWGRVPALFLTLAALTHVCLLPSAAQTKRALKPATKTSAAPVRTSQRCAGGWSGVVTLKKTLTDRLVSDEPGIRKNTDRILHRNSRDYRYVARALVDGKDPSNVQVKTSVGLSDVDQQWGQEKVFDTCNSRENGHWFIIEGTDNRTTTATASGSARSFNLTVDERGGTYSLSLEFPDALGQYRREQHVRRTGHCQPKNNEPYDKIDNEQTKIDGEGLSVYGEKLDPNNPDVISGSKTWGDDGKGEVRTFVYTATWTFTRCPASLLVTDLKFEEMRVPDWNAWQEVTENDATTDGNIIRITAKVLNLSSETKFADVKLIETYKGDKWDGAKKDYPLVNPTSIRLEAGEEREVEWIWDSEGYAWYDDGRPRLVQRVRAEAWENDQRKDSMTKNIRVAPKPLVLVPGLFSTPQSFEVYQNLLTATHSYDWKAEIFTAKRQPGGRSVYDNADDLAEFIKSVQKKDNAWHVDLVAHSSGGLIGRLFIHKSMEILPDSRPVVKHFLMLGTPNLGVPCADSMKYNDAFDGYMRTAKELMPDEMARFNQFVTERKGTIFSALVGNGSQLTCADWEPGDGFTSEVSARWLIKDADYTSDSHPDLVDQKHFGDFIKLRVITGPMKTYPIYQQAKKTQ